METPLFTNKMNFTFRPGEVTLPFSCPKLDFPFRNGLGQSQELYESFL